VGGKYSGGSKKPLLGGKKGEQWGRLPAGSDDERGRGVGFPATVRAGPERRRPEKIESTKELKARKDRKRT